MEGSHGVGEVDVAWLDHWTETRLRGRFGDRTVSRARSYAQLGRVVEMWAGGDWLGGLVTGTQVEPYEVHISRRVVGGPGPRTEWLNCSCTCPMRGDCKHAVATVITARDARRSPGPRGYAFGRAPKEDPASSEAPASPPRAPAWELALAPLVEKAQATKAATAQVSPAALRFTKSAAGSGRFGAAAPSKTPDVTIRPMIRGGSGRWVRTGVDWNDLEPARSRLVPAHADALLAVRRLRLANRYAYQSFPSELSLASLGESVWAALAEAAAAGVEFIGHELPRPRVLTSRARVRFVAEADPGPGPDGGMALHLRITQDELGVDAYLGDTRVDESLIDVGGGAPGGDRLWLVGASPHGMALWNADELVFAPLAAPLEAAVGELASGSLPVRVPGADVSRFTAAFLPALRRAVPVDSAPGVTLPEAERPRLQVVARFTPEHRVTLTTGIVYGGTIPADQYAFRDPAAEAALFATFPVDAAPPGLVVEVGGRRALAPTQVYTGGDLITVATVLLPALVTHPDVLVTIEGDPPEYRAAETEPVLEFRVDDHLGTADGEAAGADRLARTDWFDLGITVRIEDQTVTMVALFAALARGEARFMLPDGAWFSLERPEFAQLRELIEESRHLLDPERQTLRVTPVHLGLWEHLVALGVVESESAAWRERIGALTGAETRPDPEPLGLRATLRPYQVDGFRWMVRLWRAGLGGILADDMGLGKTVQVLAVAAAAKEAGELAAPLLVVAPTSVVDTWVQETAAFTPGLRVATLTKTTRKSKEPVAERIEGAHLVVTTYAIARIDAAEFRRTRWAALVIDEAQFVKNHRSKTYAALRAIPVASRFAVTGTPLENGLMDLWSLLSLTAPGLLPDPATFTEVYKRPIEEGTDPARKDRLLARIAPMLLRRTKEQVAAELPPKQEQVVRIDLAPAHRRAYDVRLARERTRVLKLATDIGANRVGIFSSLTTLRQLALAPALVDETWEGAASSKIDVLVDLLREVIEGGHRALVFSQFTRYLGMVRGRLEAEGIGTAYLDGTTADRPRAIAEFREGDASVFCISLKAGGFGLTLTEADYVFLLDPWWNPAAEQQAVDRTHRIGQRRQVMVYRLVAANTIEDKVVAMQARKRDLAAQILGDGAGLGAAMTADDLRELLS